MFFFFFCTNNVASKSIILSCIIFLYDKLKNYSIQSFKECLLFGFYLFLSHSHKLNLRKNFFTHFLRYFLTFFSVCFHCKICWSLGKVNNTVKTERESTFELMLSPCVWVDGLQCPPCLLPKTTDELLLSNLYHFMYNIQKASVDRSAL